MSLIQIENRSAKVRLDDVVTKGLIDPLIDKIATLYGDDAVRNEWTNGEIVATATDALETLELEIDSVGGSVAEGYRLYKTLMALRERGVQVVANITQTAASMGSVIAMAADKVRMVDGGTFMIHDAQASVKGDADRFRQVMNDLEQVSDELASIYAMKTGQDKDAIRTCMRKELVMNAATALRYGFVDEVYDAPKKERNPSILERMIGNRAGNNSVDDNANLVQKQSNCIMSLLDKLRPDADLVAKLELAESDAATLTAELEEAKSLVTNAAEEITGLKAEIENAKTELAEITGKLEAETKALNEAKDLLVAEQAKTTPEAINKLVTAQLATAGHPPIEDNSSDEPQTSRYEEYRNLQSTNPRAAAAFWDKYSDEIKSGK